MKSAYWGYWLVLLGVFVVIVMLLIQNVTTGTTQTYSMLQEINEAAMLDAIDYGYYRQYGEIKINKEKYYEVFSRRMAEAGAGAITYDIKFFGVVEAPPKTSVQISSRSNTFNVASDETTFDLVQKVDAIIEGESIK